MREAQHNPARVALLIGSLAALLALGAALWWSMRSDDPTPPAAQGSAKPPQDNTNPESAPRPREQTTPKAAEPPRSRPEETPEHLRKDFHARWSDFAGLTWLEARQIQEREGWSWLKREDFKVRLIDPEVWEQTCPMARDMLRDVPGAEVVAEPLEPLDGKVKLSRPEAWWTLTVRGVPILIPALRYTGLLVAKNPGGTMYGVRLYVSDDEVLNFSVEREAHVNAATRRSHLMLLWQLLDEEERVAKSTEIFGEERLSDETIHLLTFTNSPSDITCDPESAQEELRIAAALNAKHHYIDPLSDKDAHELYASDELPFRMARRSPPYWMVRINGPEQRYAVNMVYDLPDKEPYRDIGLIMASRTPPQGAAPGRPLWLERAVQALELDSPAAWKALDAALESSTITRFEKESDL